MFATVDGELWTSEHGGTFACFTYANVVFLFTRVVSEIRHLDVAASLDNE